MRSIRRIDHEPSRQALEALLDDPDLFRDVFDILEGVYRQLGRPQDLASLHERQVARATVARDRSRTRLDLAKILEEEVKDPVRAQRVVEEAVGADPSDENAIEELTRLASVNTAWKAACDALERALVATEDLPSAAAAELWIRLGGWRRDRLDDAAGSESSFLRALKLTPEDLVVLGAVEALQRVPGRERDLVATLRARAKLEPEIATKHALLREAQGLAEKTVADHALAEAVLRDCLVEDDADAWALEELTRLREAAGDAAEVVRLLLRRADLATDGAQIVALKKKAAEVLEQQPDGTAQAITLYEEIFEQEPSDAAAATKLRALYEKAGRPRDLGKLLERLIEMADSSAQRSTLRLDLARLEEISFQSVERAVATLRAILDEEPGHTEAVLAFSQLLERTGQDEDLASLLTGQIGLAAERGDREAELALRLRLGEVFEGRLKDTTRALTTYQQNPGEGAWTPEGARGGGPPRRVEVRLGSRTTALTKLVELATDRRAGSGRPSSGVRACALRGQRRDPGRAAARPGSDPRNKEVRIQIRRGSTRRRRSGPSSPRCSSAMPT